MTKSFDFAEIEGKIDDKLLLEIKIFNASIFENVDFAKFEKRITEASDLLTILALHRKKIVGFKIGYRIESTKFYSWVGGVDEKFRRQGIAAELMKRQHDRCFRNGFQIIQTKTINSFKSMLILNIKSGFDIVGVYRDKQNELKIVMEKSLI